MSFFQRAGEARGTEESEGRCVKVKKREEGERDFSKRRRCVEAKKMQTQMQAQAGDGPPARGPTTTKNGGPPKGKTSFCFAAGEVKKKKIRRIKIERASVGERAVFDAGE